MRMVSTQTKPDTKVKAIHKMPEFPIESNKIWINNRLSGTDKFTSLRFLPSFDETGNELEFLVPNADPKNMASALSNAFYQVEMTTLYRRGENHHIVTTLAPTDKRGNPIPACFKTVAGMIIGRFNYNVMVAKQLVSKGYTTSVPKEWFSKYDSKLTCEQRPNIVTMAQAVASVIDGVSMQSANGAATFIPGVFIFQKTALDSLLTMLTARRDMTKPISQANLNPNSDLFSCANGHIAQYTMQLKKGENGKERPVYGLTSNEAAPIDPQMASQWVQPWEKLIVEPFIEDQIALLVEWLGGDVVDFGLANSPYEEYLPVNIRGMSQGLECTRLKWDEVKAIPPNPNRVVVNEDTPKAPVPVTVPAAPILPTQVTPQAPIAGPAPARPIRQISFDDSADVPNIATIPQPAPVVQTVKQEPAIRVAAPLPVVGAQPAKADPATPPGANDFAANLLKNMAALGK
jgi:hypothetical protein